MRETTGPKANPRGKIVDQLGKRCASLSRYLRIHPAGRRLQAVELHRQAKGAQAGSPHSY